MPTRLTGTPSFASLGVQAPQPPNIVAIGRAPTVNDFATFNTGDLWINTSSLSASPPTAPKAEDIWMLVSKNKQIANATWINFSGGNALLTLTGNVGGAVPGDIHQNINTLGDGVGITVTGNPATNTLTWSLVGGGVATQSYLTDDAQVEVPNAAGQLTVTGTGVLSVGNVYSNLSTLRGINVNTVGTVLNSSIGQPNTNTAATQGMYALGGANNFVLDRFLYNYGTHNTFLGNLSGNLAITIANAQNNTCLGYGTGNSLTTANQCTFVGSLAGSANQTSLNNTFVGYACGTACNGGGGKNTSVGSTSSNGLTTGTQNCSFGDLSLGVTTGSNNSCFGYNSGSAYTGNESGNVLLGSGNTGVLGEANTLRIGTAAGLTRAFCQGIYGVAPVGGGNQFVIQSAAGQLGTTAIAPTPAGTNSFFAYNSIDRAAFGVGGVFTTVPFDTVLFNNGGNYNNGTYLYTAPNTGIYTFTINISIFNINAANTEGTYQLLITGGSAGNYVFNNINPYAVREIGVQQSLAIPMTIIVPMTAGDTAAAQYLSGPGAIPLPTVSGTTGTLGTQIRTVFSGYQVA
jgi:hypothetical protein